MEILKNIKVPTGNILIVEGNKWKLEGLSIGDYGRDANVKAQFLGLNKDIFFFVRNNIFYLYIIFMYYIKKKIL